MAVLDRDEYLFESSVNSEGIETKNGLSVSGQSLRAV